MNSQENRASFSRDQEKSHVKENTQNRCCERAYDQRRGGYGCSSQQSQTAIARHSVLWIAAAVMSRQSRLSTHVNNPQRVL
jgi:hypothetical protein